MIEDRFSVMRAFDNDRSNVRIESVKDIQDNYYMIYKDMLPMRYLPTNYNVSKKTWGQQGPGDCWIISCFTDLLNNVDVRFTQQMKDEFYLWLSGLGFDVNNGGAMNVASFLMCYWRNNIKKFPGRLIRYELKLDKSRITGKALTLPEKQRKLDMLLSNLIHRNWVCRYARVSGKDFKKDIQDGYVDGYLFEKKNWHAVTLSYNKQLGVLEELGSWDETKSYNLLKRREKDVFFKNILQGNIGESFLLFDIFQGGNHRADRIRNTNLRD